jgi:hypothetical protein
VLKVTYEHLVEKKFRLANARHEGTGERIGKRGERRGGEREGRDRGKEGYVWAPNIFSNSTPMICIIVNPALTINYTMHLTVT